MSTTTSHTSRSPSVPEIVRDAFLWRRKKVSVGVLLIAAATWTALEVFRFNFVTVVSWVAIVLVASMFLWVNILTLLHKEGAVDLSWLEISEESAIGTASLIREWTEEAVRWMFRASAESHWYVFASTVAGLWIFSVIASSFDLPTLLFAGVVLGMTVPVVYLKYEEKIERGWEQAKAQWRRLRGFVDHEKDKVFAKLWNKDLQVPKQKKDE